MVIGSCPSMLDALKRAGLTAKTSASVLIHGESGTGKELMAREIPSGVGKIRGICRAQLRGGGRRHCRKRIVRARARRVYRRVSRRAGCFEQADGGTLFLDEIGEASSSFQAKLLRALDRGEFVRVGGQSPVRTQVRVVSATNSDLKSLVKRDAFRLDLFYRLSAVTLALPPLRERREDIPRIVQAMLSRLRGDAGVEVQGVSEAAVEYLVGYEWPGNLREMQHTIHRAALACQKGVIRPEHLDDLKPKRSKTSNGIATLSEIEQAHIERVMLATAAIRGGPVNCSGCQGRPCAERYADTHLKRRKTGVFNLDASVGTADNMGATRVLSCTT